MTMSILSDIKFVLKKYIKNPILIAVGAYLLWKFINSKRKKESICESIKVIDDKDDTDYSIIFDKKTNKYILMKKNNKVYSADSEEDLRKMVR